MQRLDSSAADFDVRLRQLVSWSDDIDPAIAATVDEIIADVRRRGDEAVVEYCDRFDGLKVASAASLELEQPRLQQALATIEAEQRQALEMAAARVREYHQHQLQESWSYRDAHGSLLGQQITALERVGVYVPGGKASYPSSVLMNIVSAKVAGVDEIVMVVPTPRGEVSELVLAAAAIAGADRVFTVGGAQAIAALAYGTATIPRVDKIVGPGNIYVATAKRRVFGQVGIDMVAGPSEIMILSDGTTPPDLLALDLFSQAEHDENAQAILVAPHQDYLDAVADSMQRLLPQMERQAIISKSLAQRGAMILTRDLDEAIAIANQVAPEHLELSVVDAEALLPKIRHAGAIFLGRNSAEALGDYCAGPNHVLPTAATARFSSPLGVYDFQKRSSVIMCSDEGLAELAPVASVLARGESLSAHALSAERRLQMLQAEKSGG
jgi:histidinol dehydrogenase